MLLGLAVVLGFLFAEVMTASILHGFGAPITISGDIGMRETLALAAIKVGSALGAALLVVFGVASWRRMGIVGDPGSFLAGMRLLAPAGLLVICPTVGAALAGGNPLIDPDLSLELGVAFVALALVVSISEELWFRGLLVDALQSARRPWLTIIGSAVLFAVPHIPGGPAAALNAAAVGLAVGIPFTVVRLQVGSLWPLITWHAIIDTWAFLHTAAVTAEGLPDLLDAAAMLVLPALIALGYAWWFAKAQRDPA